MELHFLPFNLEFKHPFGVSSNKRTHTPVIFLQLKHKEYTGYGEACLPSYLGETRENTLAFFELAKKELKKFDSPQEIRLILESIDKLSPENNAGKAAIDIALHDLNGKLQHEPCYTILKIGKSLPSDTSATIGIDDEKTNSKKIKEAESFSFLKIKTGTNDDKALITQIRKYTDKPLFIDVNQGWNDKFFALDMIYWLKEKNTVLIEQPMPVNKADDMSWLTEKSPIPIIADESVKRLSDIDKTYGCFSGINIKLMKCTGIYEALKMITYAKEKKLKIMLGCMAESSCATSAMAQLMKLGDYIDLDAPTLLKNDPFKGVEYKSGKIILNHNPGIGVSTSLSF